MDKLDLELYDIFSDKTISDWCAVEICDRTTLEIWYATISGNVFFYNSDEFLVKDEEAWSDDDYFFKIIGHEPQIHDLFRIADDMEWEWILSDFNLTFYITWNKLWWDIEYNPTVSLLKQEYWVKRHIIDKFYIPNEE